jgi:conjugal transfer mating pair stabilization protein TraG
VHDEVARQQNAGRQQIDAQRNGLGRLTDPAKGASAEAADDVKEW